MILKGAIGYFFRDKEVIGTNKLKEFSSFSVGTLSASS
jgi:hypothetical protein